MRIAMLLSCAMLLLPASAQALDWKVEGQGGREPSLALDAVGPCTPSCGFRPPGVPPSPVIAWVDEMLVRTYHWDDFWWGYASGEDRLFDPGTGEAAVATDPAAGGFMRGVFRFAYTAERDGVPQLRYAEGDFDEVYVVDHLDPGDGAGGLSLAVVPSTGANLMAFERRVGSTAQLVLGRRAGGFEQSGWTYDVLDSAPAPDGWEPQETSIALRADETPVVSYAWMGDVRVTGLPAIPDGSCTSGPEGDLALTSAGLAQVAFLQTCAGTQRVAHAAWNGSSWTVTPLTGAGTFAGPEIAVAPGGVARFTYTQAGRGLVFRSGASEEVVDAAGTGETAMAVDPHGNVHVAYAVPGGGRYASALVTPLCAGRIPTITGTGGADTLNGTPGTDIVQGLGGDDRIDGLDGDDILCGGAGNDTIRGRAGADDIRDDLGTDRIDAGGGDDRIASGAGADTLTLGAGSDVASAGAGNDVAMGGDGEDTVQAGAGNDQVLAGTGNDVLLGEAGADILKGQDGDDQLSGGTEGDHLYGGAGNDTLDGGDGRDRCVQDAGTGTIVNCSP